MHYKLLKYSLVFYSLMLIINGCSNTRFLAGEQLLYTGGKNVIIDSAGKFRDPKARQMIKSVTACKPNNSLGGKRILPPVGLWIYNYLDPSDKKKSPGWLYRTFSSEPVLVSTVNPELRCRKLESELISTGYFRAKVWSSININSKNPRKAGITYHVKPDQPFRYHEISFATSVNAVDSIITGFHNDLILKPNNVFDLGTIKSEAKNITSRVQEEGYFYFNTSNIKWTADTNHIPYNIDLRIGRNTELMQNASKKYFIDDIAVRITSPEDSPELSQRIDTMRYEGIRIISKGMQFKPEIISRSVYFHEGDVYSLSKHQQTITQLSSYGVFKFINIQYFPDPDSLVNQLDVLIELIPMKNISLDLEANVVTKSTGFTGPGFSATLAHGNIAGGANKLQLKLDGGFEWQIGSNSTNTLGTTSYNLGLSSSLIFPRIIKPSKLFPSATFSFPQTSVTIGFELLNKIQYYRMSSINLGFGYQWRQPEKIIHIIYPLFINSINLLQTTPEFDAILDTIPYIRKSFEEQFIAGMKYDFIFDNNIMKQENGFYFQAGISSSGNLIDLIKNLSLTDQDRPYSFLSNIYSQFIKLSADFRYYRNIRNQSIVFRIYSGIGIPYSNSLVIPYVEQFYSGGSNSIRAFKARSIGPGSLNPLESSESDGSQGSATEIIDQTGDIKLEANLEYRFRLSKVLHGAVFFDAGNVWLLNPDQYRPGAEFNFSTFTDQLAVGTGIGARFDFNFFILRTDIGFPLRYNYIRDGSNWVGSTKEFFQGWLNLAIGYPF